MLMPGRYTEDTAKHCALVTSTYMMPVTTYHYANPWYTQITQLGSPTLANGGGKGIYQLTTNSAGDGIAYAIAGVDGESSLHELHLTSTSVSGPFVMSVEHADAPYEVYGATSISEAGESILAYTAPANTNTLMRLIASGAGRVIQLHPWYTTSTTYVATTATTTICDKESDNYRYGFNGKAKDNEWAGIGNSLNFGARLYDSRVSRWLSIDPLSKKYPNMSPYASFDNSPIALQDPDGKDATYSIKGNVITVNSIIRIIDASEVETKQIETQILEKWGGKNTFTAADGKKI
jgi:RHS repeat-associated protein